MNSLERVLTTLSHTEPDRVPVFLLMSMQGASVTGMPLDRYYLDPRSVAEGQLRLLESFGHDCLYTFHYASIEYEAFGGRSIFRSDGPPNAGEPILKSREDLFRLQPPKVCECAGLQNVLEATREIKRRTNGQTLILGVIMSPFSLPVMQLGFDRYLDMLTGDPEAFARLMEVNKAFCTEWAKAQLDAGAMALCYFDPVSSPTIIPRELFAKTGWPIAKEIIKNVTQGPFALHFASGRTLAVADLIAQTGAVAIGISCDENLAKVKQAFRGKITLVGNLNGIEMRSWSQARAEAEVKTAICAGAEGGGFILSDNHGEIPLQVPEDTLHAIVSAAREHGRYPLQDP